MDKTLIIYIKFMDKKRTVAVLFLGSIQRTEDHVGFDKPTDQIDFGKPVRVTLIRIPRPKRELYSRLTSITQSEPIKNFQIFFRNLDETGGRYSLLTSSNELMATSTSDILITPTKAFMTDLLVIRGVFSKLTLCVYGDVVEESAAKLWNTNAAIAETAMITEIRRNIFMEKRECVRAIQRQLQGPQMGLNFMDWQQVGNDDEINEPQIKNICNISDHLLNTFDQINQDTYIVKFRQHIQNINNYLQKLFKSKQIGLYYPKQQNYAIQNEIPLPLVHIGLASLKLLLSDQYRVLEMLKMLAQLPRHANAIIEAGGVAQLSMLFLEFYRPNAVFFSTFKNLVLQVCIALAQWPTSAQRMVTKLEQEQFQEIYLPIVGKELDEKKQKAKQKEVEKEKQRQAEKEKEKEREKERQKDRSRSRDRGKEKKSKSDQSDSDSENQGKKKKQKKDKKEKKDKKGKKEKEKSKKRDKSKEKQQKKEKEKRRDKEREKEGKNKQKDEKVKEQKIKEEKVKKEQVVSPVKVQPLVEENQISSLSFYQLLFFILLKQKNSKTLNLIKILIEQITQTLTKNKQVSQQMALITSFLRDTKYLFNQGSQMINSKSLKIFATFQPFLNQYQSENVDCKYISEKQKLKNPLKYGINPKTFRILNRINYQIVVASSKQGYSFGTPFDQNFMVLMSQLIFQKQKPILSGFTRIVNSFKAEGLMHLQKNQAAISIMAQYIYKALLDDEGLNTLLHIDQIHTSLIKFIGFLNEDPTLFSVELKSRIRLLTNYSTPYDHFTRSQGVFKVFCQYFLRLFKYQNYQIQINNKGKFIDFKKKQYQKLLNPFLLEHLLDNFSLKNFNDVTQSQPLLEVDVCLKIFLMLCDYNKNIWTTFYQNKLVSGFTSLLNKVSSLLIFFLGKTPNRWTAYASMKSYLATLDNYLSVVKHVLMLLAKKCRYQSAYNDLLEQDIFQDVQLYERVVDIYITMHNAYHSKATMVYTQKSKNKLKAIMALVVEILDQLLTSYQLINQLTRQHKIKKIVEYIYIKHYASLGSRPALLAVFATLLKIADGYSQKYFLNHLFGGHFVMNKILQSQVTYIPKNQRCILQDIFRTNIYRSDPLITHNLANLLKNIFIKPLFVDKGLDMIERIFQDLDEQFKLNEEQQNLQTWKLFRKAHLFSQLIVEANVTFKSRLDQKLMRFFKRLLEIHRKKVDITELMTENEQTNFIIFLKTKNNFMIYFSRLIKQFSQNTIFLSFLQLTSKALCLQYFTTQNNQQNSFLNKVNFEVLKTCRIYVQCLAEIGLNSYYQCLLLYGQVMQKPYKPQTFINFSQLIAEIQKILIEQRYHSRSKQNGQLLQIINSIFYFLGTLTTIDGQDLFSTQSRRMAIIHLVTPSEKEFPFKALKTSQIFRFINKQIFSLLQEYFNFPIVEKPIIIQPKSEVKPSNKIKSTLYSKAVFTIISEHDPVSKARYRYIGGEWVGGDMTKSVYTPFKIRNYDEQIQRCLVADPIKDYQKYHLREYAFDKENVTFNQLFALSLKRDKQEVPKKDKEIQRTIVLKDVVPRMTPRQNRNEMQTMQRPSPSPSKISNPLSNPNNLISPSLSNNNSLSLNNPNNRAPLNNDRNNFNRNNSNPRSNSQGNNNSSYPPNYNNNNNNNYNPRPNINTNNGMPSTFRNQMPQINPNPNYQPKTYNNYPPHYQNANMGYQPNYPPNPYYNGPPPPVYQPPRYPNYPPMRPGMDMNAPPAGGMYGGMPPMNIGGMYAPVANINQLTANQQAMFNEAFSLVNQLKNSNLHEKDIAAKKHRLNYILSNNQKVHTKLKDTLLPQQQG